MFDYAYHTVSYSTSVKIKKKKKEKKKEKKRGKRCHVSNDVISICFPLYN